MKLAPIASGVPGCLLAPALERERTLAPTTRTLGTMIANTNHWNQIRYTAYAPIYDRIAGFVAQRRRALTLLNATPGQSVFLLGAGTGADLSFLPNGIEVVGIDITRAMLQRASLRAHQLQRSFAACVMDGQRLALPAAQFDAVVLHLILAVIPDPYACVAEVERVLKPGGTVVIFDKFLPDAHHPSWGRRALNWATSRMFSDINRQLGPLLAGTSLQIAHQEPAGFAGAYQIVLLHKV
jgi:phosphatidylethanolamine/phosphatidyl-N-methylethanolamine N-methyltransferase